MKKEFRVIVDHQRNGEDIIRGFRLRAPFRLLMFGLNTNLTSEKTGEIARKTLTYTKLICSRVRYVGFCFLQ